MTGAIFDIARFALTDGPGIRSVVFFKGCPLRCQWCHNPESHSIKPEIMFFKEKCLNCGLCEKYCACGCHTLASRIHQFTPNPCKGCGQCAKVCPTKALTVSGQTVTAENVIDTLEKDSAYYNNGGGITLSGGEPLFQPEFAIALLKLAKEKNWHTAMETCGYANWNIIRQVLPLVDLWLYDVKCVAPDKHLAFTGADNSIILENLHKLNEAGAIIELRAPLIHGVNDSDNDILQLIELAGKLCNVTGIRPEPYHPFGQDKLLRLGYSPQPPFPVADDNELKRYQNILGNLYLA